MRKGMKTGLLDLLTVKTALSAGILAGALALSACSGGSGTQGPAGPQGPPGSGGTGDNFQVISVPFSSQRHKDPDNEPSGVNRVYSVQVINEKGTATDILEFVTFGVTDSVTAKADDGSAVLNLPTNRLLKITVKDAAQTIIGTRYVKFANAAAGQLKQTTQSEVHINYVDQYITTEIEKRIKLGTFDVSKTTHTDLDDLYKAVAAYSDLSDDWDDDVLTAALGRQYVLDAFRDNAALLSKFMYSPACWVSEKAAGEFENTDTDTYDANDSVYYDIDDNATVVVDCPDSNISNLCNFASHSGYANGNYGAFNCTLIKVNSTFVDLNYTIRGNRQTDADGNDTNNTDAEVTCGQFQDDNDLLPGVVGCQADLQNDGEDGENEDVSKVCWYGIRLANWAEGNDEANYEMHNNTVVLGFSVESSSSPDEDVDLLSNDGISLSISGVSNVVSFGNQEGEYDTSDIDVDDTTTWVAKSATARASLDSTSVIWLFDKCTNDSRLEFVHTGANTKLQLNDDVSVAEGDADGATAHVQMAVARIPADNGTQYAAFVRQMAERIGKDNPKAARLLAAMDAVDLGGNVALPAYDLALILGTTHALCDKRLAFGADDNFVVGRETGVSFNVANKGYAPNRKVTAKTKDASYEAFSTEFGHASWKIDGITKGDTVTISSDGIDDQTCTVE